MNFENDATQTNRYVILIVFTSKLVWTLPCLWVCVPFVLSSLGITWSRKHGSLLWQIHSWTGGHASAGCKTRYCIILIFLLCDTKLSVMSISWSQSCKKHLLWVCVLMLRWRLERCHDKRLLPSTHLGPHWVRSAAKKEHCGRWCFSAKVGDDTSISFHGWRMEWGRFLGSLVTPVVYDLQLMHNLSHVGEGLGMLPEVLGRNAIKYFDHITMLKMLYSAKVLLSVDGSMRCIDLSGIYAAT